MKNADLLLKEKKKWEELRNNYVAEHIPYPAGDQAHLVRMTPEQLQTLISEVVQKVEEGEGKTPDQRIDRLEKLLLEINNNNKKIEEQQKMNQSVLEAIQNLKESVEKKNIIVPTVKNAPIKTNKPK